MGRKGVSKRKAGKTKPLSNDKASGSVSPLVVAAVTKPVKSVETGKAAVSSKDNGKTSGKKNKKSKKE